MRTKSKPVRAKPKPNYAFQTQPKPDKQRIVYNFTADDIKKYFTTKKGALAANKTFIKEVIRPQNETKCRFKTTGLRCKGRTYFSPSDYRLAA
jgi:hypothetical protein